MESADAGSRIRIAIALALLSHKPPEQSIESYILDLKEQFPVPQCPTAEARPDNPWRTRALALEEENERLRFDVQKYEFEILALKAAPMNTGESNQDPESSQAPKKKKRKLAPPISGPGEDKLDLRALIKDICSGPRLPALQASLDILTSFRTLQLSGERPADERDQKIILIPNVKRSLSALGKLLSAVLRRDESVVATSASVDITNNLRDLLLTLLSSILLLAPRDGIFPHIMGNLTECIVRPIILAFYPLSVREITCGVDKTDRKKSDIDVRPNLMNILQRLISCLRTLKTRTRDLREFMIFETASEIETLWSTTMHSGDSRNQRISVLARKDALWYHCSVIHTALDRFPAFRPREEDKESLLCSEAVRTLAGLMRHFEQTKPIDEVAKNMVLGVLEKAWLSGLYEPTQDGEIGC